MLEADPAQFAESLLPRLHCLVASGDTVRADLVTKLTAAIISNERLFYFEVAATSASTAHAIAGAVTENRLDALWKITGQPFGSDWQAVTVGKQIAIRDTRLSVSHFKGHLYHVAVLDMSGELILADNDRTLWEKLRAQMSCPTLKAWGEAVVPAIKSSKMLIPAQAFGVGELKAYILAPDASEKFDSIIGAHVRRLSGTARPSLRKEAA